MASTAETIRKVSIAAEVLNGSTIDDAREIGAALQGWIAGGCEGSLDQALSLRTHGGISPREALRLGDRDMLLRTIANQFWPELAPSGAALMIVQSFERYASSSWARDRERDCAPADSRNAAWWSMLRSGVDMPSSKRISQILKREIQDRV